MLKCPKYIEKSEIVFINKCGRQTPAGKTTLKFASFFIWLAFQGRSLVYGIMTCL